MKSLEQRFEDLQEDPERSAKIFKIAVIVSYCSLMFGAILIVAYFAEIWL